MTNDTLYSVKAKAHWFWRTGFTRDQILQKLRDMEISDEWLVCPLGNATQAITIEVFVTDPQALRINKKTSVHEPEHEERCCAECGAAMRKIRLIDNGHNFWHYDSTYADADAPKSFFLRQYPIAGTIAAFMCSSCGLVRLYGRRTARLPTLSLPTRT
ncbi:MAG: hypothetical protein ABGZ53_11120 [Fuerstiella sp.]